MSTKPFPAVERGYPFPELELATLELPRMELSEACTVTKEGRVLVAAEGRPARFVEVAIPR